MTTYDVLLKVASDLEKEACEYDRMAGEGKPIELRKEWRGVARGLQRAATVLFAEAYSQAKEEKP